MKNECQNTVAAHLYGAFFDSSKYIYLIFSVFKHELIYEWMTIAVVDLLYRCTELACYEIIAVYAIQFNDFNPDDLQSWPDGNSTKCRSV